MSLPAHRCRCHRLPRDPGVRSLDRVYLNVYQPKLQTPRAVFYFLREHYGEGAVSSHQMKAITEELFQNNFSKEYCLTILPLWQIRQ